MAKPKRRRDASSSSLTSLVRENYLADQWGLPSLFSAVRSPLLEVEDRRTWSPEPILDDLPRGPRGISKIGRQPVKGRATPKGRATYSTNFRHAGIPVFEAPKFVAICVRRKQRREVLLALGKGGGGKRHPRRNQFSNVRC
ncbi:MAG: hypothetical protein [Microvirus sp.]|nr:MAG: hypothetical protein [Microvirus sp.]